MQPWPLLGCESDNMPHQLSNAGNLREHEAITVEPVGVLGVEPHDPVEEDVGDGSHAPAVLVSMLDPASAASESWQFSRGSLKRNRRSLHRRTRVARVGVERRISLEDGIVSN